MELGPLSEWVGAVAEFLAVSVALFLPYYNQYQARKRRTQRFTRIIDQTFLRVLNNDLADFADFKAFIHLTSLIETDPKLLDELRLGDQLVRLVGDATSLTSAQLNDIQALQAHFHA